jgi:hypothetical protein
MDAVAAWSEWLSSPHCRPALTGAARFIYRQAMRLGLPHELLPCTNPWELPPDERADCFEMLADDLWIFLRSRPANWPLKSQWAILAARGERFVMLRIAQEFLSYLKDKARTYSYDPARALYRRLRQVLQEEDSVAYRATDRGAFYSLDPEAPSGDALLPLEAEPYSGWDAPIGLVAMKDLDKKSSLLVLARFFGEEARRRLGKACFLPVRELVRFVSAHYPVPSTFTTVPLSAGQDDSTNAPSMSIESLREECSGEASFVARQLEDLAQQLAASWSQKQRAVFALVQGDDHTLSEAARQVGYRSAAGAAYVYNTALDILRDFCLQWPGLSPPDLDERLFEAFVLQLAAICKRDIQGRISEMKAHDFGES